MSSLLSARLSELRQQQANASSEQLPSTNSAKTPYGSNTILGTLVSMRSNNKAPAPLNQGLHAQRDQTGSHSKLDETDLKVNALRSVTLDKPSQEMGLPLPSPITIMRAQKTHPQQIPQTSHNIHTAQESEGCSQSSSDLHQMPPVSNHHSLRSNTKPNWKPSADDQFLFDEEFDYLNRKNVTKRS